MVKRTDGILHKQYGGYFECTMNEMYRCTVDYVDGCTLDDTLEIRTELVYNTRYVQVYYRIKYVQQTGVQYIYKIGTVVL